MASNPSSIHIIFETGSQMTWTAPDLSFADGYILQGESIDVSDIDAGIFWDRFCILDDESIRDDCADPIYKAHQRVCVQTGADLAKAVLIEVNGIETFVRDRRAQTKCGLLNVLLYVEPEQDELPVVEVDDVAPHAPSIVGKLQFDDEDDED